MRTAQWCVCIGPDDRLFILYDGPGGLQVDGNLLNDTSGKRGRVLKCFETWNEAESWRSLQLQLR